MSWYLFRDAACVNQRGIKVDGFQDMHRPRLNLSWGINESDSNSVGNAYEKDIVPSTIIPGNSHESDPNNNIKVLTETSDDEQEELMKLIKNQNDRKREHEIIEHHTKMKQRSQSIMPRQDQIRNSQKQEKSQPHNQEIDKRIRYLENSLLPICKRDNMATILDHNLGKEVPLSDSRMSGRSFFHNKKNESNVVLGNGYNVFTATEQAKKDLTQQLKEMYSYDDMVKRRAEQGQIRFG